MTSSPPLTAANLMTTDVETVAPDGHIGEVFGRLARAAFNGFPTVNEGSLVGSVARQDVLWALRDERQAAESGEAAQTKR